MRSLARIMSVLECVSAHAEGASIVEIAKCAELHISTASRLAHALRDEGILELNSAERYVVGNRVLSLARKGMDQNELFIRAHPQMLRLRDVTGETISLHVSYEDKRVCIGEVRSQHQVSRAVPPGEVKPLIGTATGAALMIDLSEEELAGVLAAHGGAAAELPAIVAGVARCRELGWSFVDTWVEGVSALAVPLRSGGRVVAALTVSGPTSRYTEDVALTTLDNVLAAARQLSGEPVKRPAPNRMEAS